MQIFPLQDKKNNNRGIIGNHKRHNSCVLWLKTFQDIWPRETVKTEHGNYFFQLRGITPEQISNDLLKRSLSY
jgi:hypothetical protein